MMIKKLIYSIGKIEGLRRNTGYIKYFLTDDLLKKIENLNEKDREVELYNALENIYLNKKYYFFNVLDELILKGVNIFGNINFEKTSKEDFKYLLTIREDKNRYLNLNWEQLGLENLTELFDIRSDLFFNNLPIERFKYFNEKLTDEEIIKFFKENKFVMKNLNEENIEKRDIKEAIKIEEMIKEEYKCTLIDIDVLNLSLKEEKEFLTKKEEILSNSFESFQGKHLRFVEKNPQIKGEIELKELLNYLA